MMEDLHRYQQGDGGALKSCIWCKKVQREHTAYQLSSADELVPDDGVAAAAAAVSSEDDAEGQDDGAWPEASNSQRSYPTLPYGQRTAKDGEILENDEIQPVFQLDTSEFAGILKTTSYVDKTELIKEFLEDGWPILITTPRGFGKSTNVSMLKCFFEIEVRGNGKPKTKANYFTQSVKDTNNYELFIEKKLIITRYSTYMHNYFGSYPVIYVDFKCDDIILSLDDASNFCKKVVHKSFKEHKYLLKSRKLNKTEKDYCKLWCDDDCETNVPNCYVAHALRILSFYLRSHFNRKVIVLIDNYDSLIINIMFSVQDRNELSCITRFNISIMHLLLKGNNENVERGMMVGSFYISLYHSGVLGFDNITYYRFSEIHRYTDYFGLTEYEVEKLFNNPIFQLNSDLKDDAISMYSGYKYRDGTTIYNLWSVMNFLKTKVVKSYWLKSELVEYLKWSFQTTEIRSNMQKLLFGEISLYRFSDKHITPEQMIELRDIMMKAKLDDHFTDLFCSFLIEQGYLLQQFNDFHDVRLYVKLPNGEIKEELFKELTSYYTSVCGFDENLIEECRNFFDQIPPSITPEDNDFQRMLNKFCKMLEYLFSVFSHNNFIELTKESLFCLMYYVIYPTKYIKTVNSKTTMVLFKNRFGLILNVKYLETAKAALYQILNIDRYNTFDRKYPIPEDTDNYLLMGLNMDINLKPSLCYLMSNKDINRAKYIFL